MTSNITHVPNAESEKKMTENGYTPTCQFSQNPQPNACRTDHEI